ncbi:lysophosphatidylserine lipase ABHD12 isoform X1 [Euwallacea fornicatus]|uniref:lysophosphatidylserine lipase ABHD12 isoform X1 n=2 Tax=Euwallacea fornicatus TaxID=995702 RepID=UPI00338F2206
MCCGRCCIIYSICSAIVLLLLVLVFFVILPITFMFSLGMQRSLIFPTYLINPENYSNPEQYGISGVRNMYVDFLYPTENITIGMWQILPKEIVSDVIRNEEYNFEGVLADDKYYILLYLHGNGSDRTKRVPLYEILRKFFHVFAIDYRGYADSSGGNNLSETSVVKDVVSVYKWLRERSKSKIFIWGHSLGTGVATHLLANLKKDNISAMGLALETPFTSVTDVVKKHPLVTTFSFLPWWHATLVNPLINNDFNFDSASYIKDVDCPIMILHAKDDEDVPYQLATQLYYTALNQRNFTYQGNVIYHLFEPKGYGHMMLYRESDLPKYVKLFVNECVKFSSARGV